MLDASARQGLLKPIRLVIVDRQPIVLQGLKSVLGSQQDFDVVASSSDGASCLEAIRNFTPDLALIGDTRPDLTASDILRIAKTEQLSTRVVFFTESDVDDNLTAAIAAGACSTISKYAAPATMLQSLRLMTTSGVLLQQRDLLPIGSESEVEKVGKLLTPLTQREREIALLVSEGKSNKEIARELNVSHGTVKVHLYNIFQKLEITNRTVLATLALLQRTSGVGVLALAFLAFALADDLEASEANDARPDDNQIGRADERATYEVWKKAILQHVILSQSARTPVQSEKDPFANASQAANMVTAMEASRAAQQFMGSQPWKDFGSSAPSLPVVSLRGMNDAPLGDEPATKHQLPQFASGPMSSSGGYGTFAAVAGALIYALQDTDPAQAHGRGPGSKDLLTALGENAAATLATTAHVGDDHAGNSAAEFLSRDLSLRSVSVTSANDVAREDARGQTSPDHDAGPAGFSHDRLIGGNVEHVVGHFPIDTKPGSSDPVLDFASGPGRLNLAAFGGLAWLHLTAGAKSIPPHTLAWVYDSARNETIVYVNPTDRTLDIGDRRVMEIHLQGIVSVAESDVVEAKSVAVAATLEQLEQALAPATSDDETGSNADNVRDGDSSLGAAGIWGAWTDDGSSFHFAQVRTGFGTLAKSNAVTRDSDATGESVAASGVTSPSSSSSSSSSSAPGHNATAPASEGLAKSKPNHADTGAPATKQMDQPGPATADSGGPGNSENASEQGAAHAANAPGQTRDGGSNGKGAEHKASDTAKAPAAEKTSGPKTVEKSSAGHDRHPHSAIASEADEMAQPGVATGEGPGRGHSQHASEPGSAKGSASEAKSTPDSGLGKDKGHHASASDDSLGHVKAAKVAEHKPSAQSSSEVEGAGGKSHGNSEHGAEPEPPKPGAERIEKDTGVGNGEERHASASEPGKAQKIAEPADPKHGAPEDSVFVNGPEQPKPAGRSAEAGGHAGDGTSQEVARSGAAGSQPAQPIKAALKMGGADRDLVFRFDGKAVPSTEVPGVELKEPGHPQASCSPQDQLGAIVETGPNAPGEHGAHHGTNAEHHGSVPHDWLI
ncbi:MAG: response regulator [Bradyrhizobium sp.]|uniref:LuxR C-terminal-related transcriptional regulator n=1 Tax=Bradyrhizobium sp. TaxID=376 RepID=UPI001A26F9A2|nr:LuxR C-terminal-related transcriptional regulator [Bradyrhizobium sp.]MBJ7405863.1 response regulator [Bradyrhizobium sp.]